MSDLSQSLSSLSIGREQLAERSRYQYEPIANGSSHVRMFTLLPGALGEPIKGLLTKSTLLPKKEYFRRDNSRSTPPKYEALSYAWGPLDDMKTIYIRTATNDDDLIAHDGSTVSESVFEPLEVTHNLAEALPYLRLRHRSRTLWIDAICVDQQNLKERSHQVQRMADIYSVADPVIVWLGVEGFETKAAFDVLELVYSEVRYEFGTSRQKLVAVKGSGMSKSGSTSTEDSNDWIDPTREVPCESDEIQGLADLLGRPWFTRLWVCQEVQLARSNAVVLCGDRKLPWTVFRHGVAVLNKKKVTVSASSENLSEQDSLSRGVLEDKVKALRSLTSYTEHLCKPLLSTEYHIYVLAGMTRSAQCADVRDRLYALLSLAGSERYGIIPDYNQPAAQIFKEVAQRIMTIDKSLGALVFVLVHSNDLNLPSWVPELSKSARNRASMPKFRPNGQSRHFSFSNDTLISQGVAVSKIHNVAKVAFGASFSDQEFKDRVLLALSKLKLKPSEPYFTGIRMDEALARTLAVDAFAENTLLQKEQHPSRSNMHVYLSLISDKLDDDTDLSESSSKILRVYKNYVRIAMKRRVLFSTAEGYIGTCPVEARPGDHLVHLLGCSLPMLLRRTSDDTYNIVGAAYCHGFMRGEAFLRDLPPAIDIVETKHHGVSVYVNRETQETQIEDPRFGELPSGWSIVEHKKSDQYHKFREESSGEEYESKKFDPRMSPDILKARGISIQEFKIV